MRTAANTGMLLDLSQNSASKIIDTTGTERIIASGTSKKASHTGKKAQREPRIKPASTLIENAVRHLLVVLSIAKRKDFCPKRETAFCKTRLGSGSIRGALRYAAVKCHITSSNMADSSIVFLLKVEFFIREFSTYGCLIELKEYVKQIFYRLTSFICCNKCVSTVWNCLLCNGSCKTY